MMDKLKILNQRFRYKKDGLIDNWRLFRLKDEHWEGDCDDYAINAVWLLSDQSLLKMWWNLLTCRAVIWMVWSPNGVAHARLNWRGQWICNIWPLPQDECGMDKVMPMILPIVAIKLAVGKILQLFGK